MLKTIKKLLYIIPASKVSLLGMMVLFIFSSVLEVVGVSAIAPFIKLAKRPKLIHDYSFLEQLFNTYGTVDERKFVAYLGLFVIILFLLKVVIAWLTQVCIFRFSCRQQKLLTNKLVNGYIKAPYTYHLNKNSSYIIDNIIEVANKFSFIVHPLFSSIASIFISAALFILLWRTSSEMMLILVAILLPVLLLINSFKHKLREWGKQSRQSKVELIKTINHSLGGIKETKVIGCEKYFLGDVDSHIQKLETSQSNFFSFQVVPRYLIEMAMLTSIVGTISYFLFVGNNMDNLQSVLSVYALASIRLLPAFNKVVNGINVLRNHSYTVDQIYLDLKELQQDLRHNATESLEKAPPLDKHLLGQGKRQVNLPTHTNQLGSSEKLSFQHTISLENISYSYPNQVEQATEDLCLEIQKGESIAFIGKSGAGKTTLVDIILGLLIPQQGDIRVDGVSIYDNLRAWQNLVGYIPQSIFLADDTVKRNIAFGIPDESIDIDKLYQAIEMAQLSQVVDNLPHGIETGLGERGVLLSGGQRQRVGIARALYHEREILILDEATAALDNETEKLVTQSINALSGKKTLITIAHRLTTVEKCDRVYEFNKGRIVRSGSYQEVVQF